jgi:hypothetical protein
LALVRVPWLLLRCCTGLLAPNSARRSSNVPHLLVHVQEDAEQWVRVCCRSCQIPGLGGERGRWSLLDEVNHYMGATLVKQIMRHLSLVAALISCIFDGTPSSFVITNFGSAGSNAMRITPVIDDERSVNPSQGAFFVTIATPHEKGIILGIPDGRSGTHFDDEINAKIARPVSTDVIRIGRRDARSSTRWFINSETEGRTRRITCRDDTSAVLRPVYPSSPVPKPKEVRVTLHYDKLALHFKSAPQRVDSLCTLVSQRAALPVIVDVTAGPGAGPIDASQQITASVTTATLDIIPTRTDVRRCDFSLMRSLTRPVLGDPTKPLPSGTNECYLNGHGSGSINGFTARWSIPGLKNTRLTNVESRCIKRER